MSGIPPGGGWQPTNLQELAHQTFQLLEDLGENATAKQQEQIILAALQKAQELSA